MRNETNNGDDAQSKSSKLTGGFKRRKLQRLEPEKQDTPQQADQPIDQTTAEEQPRPPQPTSQPENAPAAPAVKLPLKPRLQPGNAILVMRSGNRAGTSIALDQDCTVLGRFRNRDQLDVQQARQTQCAHFVDLTDENDPQTQSVSRLHAEIYWKSGELLLTDLGSTHGTYVNNNLLPGYVKPAHGGAERVRSRSVCLEVGNTIRIAGFLFELQLRDE